MWINRLPISTIVGHGQRRVGSLTAFLNVAENVAEKGVEKGVGKG
jgi:hypothetical protein